MQTLKNEKRNLVSRYWILYPIVTGGLKNAALYSLDNIKLAHLLASICTDPEIK
jgi:hypothetical protein